MEGLYYADPREIRGEMLDRFLAAGWYRIGHRMFTTDSIDDFGNIYPVYWLRYDVPTLTPVKSYQKLSLLNKNFSVEIKPFELTDELEELHSAYFNHIDFITTSSIEELLVDTNNLLFDSKIIEIRDSGKLIGAGIFDQGSNAIAGIKNIYHPEYKKYSLGKYLIWLKYQYCLHQNIKWYYPGYFAPANPKFNYKLDFDKKATQVYLPPEINSWIPLNDFIPPL